MAILYGKQKTRGTKISQQELHTTNCKLMIAYFEPNNYIINLNKICLNYCVDQGDTP